MARVSNYMFENKGSEELTRRARPFQRRGSRDLDRLAWCLLPLLLRASRIGSHQNSLGSRNMRLTAGSSCSGRRREFRA